MSILNFKHKNNNYTIGGNICSIIEYCKMFKEYSKNLPEYKLFNEVCFDNEAEKNELINSIHKCSYFKIEDSSLVVTIMATKKEIKKYKEEYKREYFRFLSVLKTYFIKEQYADTIEAYLLKNYLKYILKDLKK